MECQGGGGGGGIVDTCMATCGLGGRRRYKWDSIYTSSPVRMSGGEGSWTLVWRHVDWGGQEGRDHGHLPMFLGSVFHTISVEVLTVPSERVSRRLVTARMKLLATVSNVRHPRLAYNCILAISHSFQQSGCQTV